MDAMDALQKYYGGHVGNLGRVTPTLQTDPKHVVEDTEIVHLDKDETDEARHTVEDHGFDPSSPEGKRKIKEVLEAIRQKKREKGVQKSLDTLIEKVTAEAPVRRGRPAKSTVSPDRGQPEASAGNEPWFAGPARKVVDARYPKSTGDFQGQESPKPSGSPEDEEYQALFAWFKGGRRGKKPFCERHNDCNQDPMSMEDEERDSGYRGREKSLELSLDCKECQQEPLHKAQGSPAVNALVAMAAGWALSSDITDKDVPSHLVREWERAVSQQDKTRLQEEMIRRLRHKLRKSEDDGNFLDDLQILYKDHAPLPPRYGLLWDAVKHRWTRPEKVGRTVWEVQGKIRYRGTGSGAHERSRSAKGSGGYGVGSAEAGRRFRTTGDTARQHPHESKQPGQHALHPFRRKKTRR